MLPLTFPASERRPSRRVVADDAALLQGRSGGNAGRHEPERAEAGLAALDVGEARRRDDGGKLLHPVGHAAVDQDGERQAGEKPTGPLEVHNQQPAAGLEDATDLGKAARLQVVRQVVHHQAAEHDVEGGIGEGQGLNSGHTVVDAETAASGFLSGDGDHLGGRIDAANEPGRSGAGPCAPGEFAGAAADLEDGLARPDSGEVGGLLAHGWGAAKGDESDQGIIEARPADDATARASTRGGGAVVADHTDRTNDQMALLRETTRPRLT